MPELPFLSACRRCYHAEQRLDRRRCSESGLQKTRLNAQLGWQEPGNQFHFEKALYLAVPGTISKPETVMAPFSHLCPFKPCWYLCGPQHRPCDSPMLVNTARSLSSERICYDGKGISVIGRPILRPGWRDWAKANILGPTAIQIGAGFVLIGKRENARERHASARSQR